MRHPVATSVGEGFMQRYCTRCHATALAGAARQGAPDHHNLETVELARTQIDVIDGLGAADPDAVNTEMPRTPRTSES